MSLIAAALALELVPLHKLDGRTVMVNPETVTQLIEPKGDGEANKLMVDKVRCVVTLLDRNYVSVAETCDEVRKLLEDEP